VAGWFAADQKSGGILSSASRQAILSADCSTNEFSKIEGWFRKAIRPIGITYQQSLSWGALSTIDVKGLELVPESITALRSC
jgi:hypothetical protein